jgi:cysteine desulfurase / selenocysteine lyase
MPLRKYFNHSKGFIHLNNAGVTPLSIPCEDAIVGATQYSSSHGFHGYDLFFPKLEQARKTIGDFINVDSKQIAFVNNCSTAISLFAFGLDLKKGDEIVISDQEYPSNRYPWFNRAHRDGLVVTEIKSEADGKINWEKFIAAIGPKTRVIPISWVQYATGVRAPLKEISAKAKKVGAVVVVDVIQGLGVIPFDFKELGVDAVACGSHKWLCGQLGHGFLAVSSELSEKVYPLIQGALTYGTPELPFDVKNPMHKTAARFESGGINVIGSMGLAASVSMFNEVGKENIYREAMALRDYLIATLKAKGLRVAAELPAAQSSPIVTFFPKTPVEEVSRKLAEKKISFAPRFGGIRISPHAFNTKEEIDLVCQTV